MTIDRVFTPGLAQVAYLVADESAGEVAVIDPRRDVQSYLDWATERGLRIVAILETHVHADFVSGALELQAASGAPIYASRLGNQEFEHVPIDDRDNIAVGRLTLEARWTPGHTPEHLAFVLFDPAVGNEAIAFFSGDLLFVGDVGRPDLLGSKQTEGLANHLFDTFATRLADLPDRVIVYPGHTAGSSCGKRIGDAPTTTLGNERKHNYALQQKQREAFIAAVMDTMPLPPAYYPTMKAVNTVGARPLDGLTTGGMLTPDAVARFIDEGAVLIDARSAEAFDRCHIPGVYFAGETPDFVNWVGWRAPYDRPLVLLLNDDGDFDQYVTELHRIGLDMVAGFLQGGIDAWTSSGRPVRSLRGVSPMQLHRSIESGEMVTIIDVRTESEWIDGHIPGSKNVFAGRIATGAQLDSPQAGEIALACATGYRSRVAASMLAARGVENLLQLTGGLDAWAASGYPVEAA
ncbi:MAG: rhodanese-like domain-containing protein [Thermomicrobiales bacterium]